MIEIPTIIGWFPVVLIIVVIVYFLLLLISLIGINRKLKYFNNAFDEYLKYTFNKGNGSNIGNL